MARDGITSDVVNQIESRQVCMAFLLDLQFADQTLYVWTGVGPLVWNGNTYQGVGDFGELSAIGETSTVEAQGITLGLSGIDPTLLRESMYEINHAGKAWVRLAFFGPAGNVVAVVPAYMGRMDKP